MSKYWVGIIVGGIGIFFWYFIISWFVEGSSWLHFFLALSLVAPITSKIYEDVDEKIKQLQIQVEMMKDEIMSLTSIIENNESKIDSVEDIDRRLSNLEYRFREN
jgi:hypothetical protein